MFEGLTSEQDSPEQVSESEDQKKAREAKEKKKKEAQTRTEQIKKTSETDRSSRLAEKLRKIRESRKKTAEGAALKAGDRPKREHYERLAKRLLTNIEAKILLDDRASETKSSMQLGFEAEVAAERLFRKFNLDGYGEALRAKALEDSLRIHEQAHRALEASKAALERKKSQGKLAEGEEVELELLEEIIGESKEKFAWKQQELAKISKQQLSAKELADGPTGEIDNILSRAAQIEKARKEGLLPENWDQKTIGLKRVANHRKIGKITNRIEKDRKLTDEDREQLKVVKQGLLVEQFSLLAQTKIKTTTESGGTETKEVLEVLGSTEGKILREMVRDSQTKMLGKEYSTWQKIISSQPEINSLFLKLRGLNLTGMTQDQRQAQIRTLALTERELQLIETLSHPEVVGRLKVMNAERRGEIDPATRTSLDTEEEVLQDIEEFERWRLEGPVAERMAAVREDFMMKAQMLDTEDYTEDDLYETLSSYGFAFRNERGVWELKSVEGGVSVSKDTNDLLAKARKIRNQYSSTMQILPEDVDGKINRDAVKNVLEAVGKDISTDSKVLNELYDAGIVEVIPTNTGMTISINTYTAGGAEGPIKDKLEALMKEFGVDLGSAAKNGLGLTFKESSLENFNRAFSAKFHERAMPSVNILVLPDRADYLKQQALLLAHEQQDYLFDAILFPDGDQSKEAEAMREIVSKLLDHKIDGKTKIDLQDLYLLEPQAGESANVSQRENMFLLAKTLEAIINKNTLEAGADTYDAMNTDDLIRSQLAMDIIGQIQAFGMEGINMEYILALAGKYGLDRLPQINPENMYHEAGRAGTKEQRSAAIKNLRTGKYKYAAIPGLEPLIGPLGDDTSPMNTGYQEAIQRGMYIGRDKPPPTYGGEGTAFYDVWEYNVDARAIPLRYLIPGMRRFSTLLGSVPVPWPMLTNYEFRRGIGARLARSKSPRLRDLGKYYMGSDYLGANPAKYFKYFNTQYEGLFKQYLPGIQNAYRIEEGRDRTPVSLQMDIEEFTHKKGLAWMAEILGQGGVGEIKRLRILGELMGSKFDFDPMTNQYKFKRDEDKMRSTRDIVADVVDKKDILGADKLAKLRTKAAGDPYLFKDLRGHEFLNFISRNFRGDAEKVLVPGGEKFTYKEHDKGKTEVRRFGIKVKRDITPWMGSGRGFLRMVNPLRRYIAQKPGKLQEAAGEYYEKYVTRSRLPGQDAEKIGWRDQVGKEFKKFLNSRDGYLAYMTLKDEHDHFAQKVIGKDKHGNPIREDYALYSMVNMIHIAEELRGQDAGAWAVNTRDEDVKLTFKERGQVKTITVRPGERLVDQNGNLIPVLLKEARWNKEKKMYEGGGDFIIKDGVVQLNTTWLSKDEDESRARMLEVQKYWGRLVGDRLNPHLRFIRLNSACGQGKAVSWFGGNKNIDEGFDEENVLLRTDAVKDALLGMQIEVLKDVLVKGLPPDRRYKMHRTKEGQDLIDFRPQFTFTDATGVKHTHDTFDAASGFATTAFKNYVKRLAMNFYPPSSSGIPHPKWPAIEETLNKPDVTHEDISKIVEAIVGPNHGGQDAYFENIMHFKTYKEPSWTSPYRRELDAIGPRPIKEVTTMQDMLAKGIDTFRGRYEHGQNMMDQWLMALRKIGQYERIGYEKAGYYKGIAKWLTRLTNQMMVGGLIASALTGTPIGLFIVMSGAGLRGFAKPAAVKNAKKWHTRRIKAIEKYKDATSMAGAFQAALQGEIPQQQDLSTMRYYTEVITFWLEDLAATKEPDDWYPTDDLVLKKTGQMFEMLEERIKEASKPPEL
ncbi:hypothetical protein JW978_02225 [Candidatus Dojkabacteria bacterium]|nr:hypothetical protein [Candidatus Dojkabacteria bacterium]